MKTTLIVFFLLLLSVGRNFSQPAGNPPPYVNRLTNSLYTINYGCVTDENTYFYEIFAYEITGLNQNPVYSFNTQSPTLFESAEYEPYPLSFTPYGNYWKWPSSTITIDTVVLTLEGYNANLNIGTDVLGFGISYNVYNPPNPIEIHGDEKWTWFEVVLDPDIQISGSELSCSNPVTYYLLNMPTTYTSATWTIKQGTTTRASGNGTTATASNLVDGSSQVAFTLHFECGLNDVTITKDFWFGKPIVEYISGPSEGYVYNTYTFYAHPQRDPLSQSQYDWILNPLLDNDVRPYYDYTDIAFYDSYSNYQVVARSYNTCGYSDYQYTNIEIYDNRKLFVLSPNPASEFVTISISKESYSELKTEELINGKVTYSVQVVDYFGKVYFSGQKSGSSFILPVSFLKNGNYIVNIRYANESENHPLIIKH